MRIKGRDDSRRLAQPTLGPVARDGVADALGAGEADANDGRGVVAIPRLGDDRATGAVERLGGQEEVGALLEALDDEGRFPRGRRRRGQDLDLGGQALAAAGAATGDDLLAILGRHAETKAVTAAAHQ